jgi:hypothetical protein
MVYLGIESSNFDLDKGSLIPCTDKDREKGGLRFKKEDLINVSPLKEM